MIIDRPTISDFSASVHDHSTNELGGNIPISSIENFTASGPLSDDQILVYGYGYGYDGWTNLNALDYLVALGFITDTASNEIIDDRVATLIQDGTGISWVYDDGANTLTPTISLSPFSTTDLSEGTNLYYTDERVDDRVASLIQDGTGISWTYVDGSNTLTPTISLSSFSTTDLSEGTNLYYTDERVDDRVALLIQNGGGITWTYSDGANTLTPDVTHNSVSGLQGGTATEYYHLTSAQHTEITTFFASTDISAAEAETLTDGSNADSLHIHTASGISGFSEAVDDRVAVLIQNGTDLSWTYVDGSNTLTGNVSSTLQTVTDRGATTTNDITVTGDVDATTFTSSEMVLTGSTSRLTLTETDGTPTFRFLDNGTDYGEIYKGANRFDFYGYVASGSSNIYIDPRVGDNSSASRFIIWRTTNTTGNRTIAFQEGNGANDNLANIRISGASGSALFEFYPNSSIPSNTRIGLSTNPWNEIYGNTGVFLEAVVIGNTSLTSDVERLDIDKTNTSTSLTETKYLSYIDYNIAGSITTGSSVTRSHTGIYLDITNTGSITAPAISKNTVGIDINIIDSGAQTITAASGTKSVIGVDSYVSASGSPSGTVNYNAYGYISSVAGNNITETGFGLYSVVNTVTENAYGVYSANNSFSTNGYGGFFISQAAATYGYGIYADSTGGGTVNYGIYATASGADTNWAGYFASGDVYIANTLFLGSDGSASNPVITRSTDTNTGIYFGSDAIYFTNGGNRSLSIFGQSAYEKVSISHASTLTTGLPYTAALGIDATFTSSSSALPLRGIEIEVTNPYTSTPTSTTIETYGINIVATSNGALGSNGGTIRNTYGIRCDVNETGSNIFGSYNKNVYGGYFDAFNNTNGTTVSYGIYATANGADTNWAGYFNLGNVYIANELRIGATGSATNPAINRNADDNTGIFWDSSGDQFSMAAGGTEVLRIEDSHASSIKPLVVGGVSAVLHELTVYDDGVTGANFIQAEIINPGGVAGVRLTSSSDTYEVQVSGDDLLLYHRTDGEYVLYYEGTNDAMIIGDNSSSPYAGVRLTVQQSNSAQTSVTYGTTLALESNGNNYISFMADTGETGYHGLCWGDSADNLVSLLRYQHSSDIMQLYVNNQYMMIWDGTTYPKIMMGNNNQSTAVGDGVVEIETNASCNLPALLIDQNDTGEPYIALEGSVVTTGINSASTVGPDSGIWIHAGMFEIQVNGTRYFVPYFQGAKP